MVIQLLAYHIKLMRLNTFEVLNVYDDATAVIA